MTREPEVLVFRFGTLHLRKLTLGRGKKISELPPRNLSSLWSCIFLFIIKSQKNMYFYYSYYSKTVLYWYFLMSYFRLGTKQYHTYIGVNSFMHAIIIVSSFATIRVLQLRVWAHPTVERFPVLLLQRWGSDQAELSRSSMGVSVCSYGCECVHTHLEARGSLWCHSAVTIDLVLFLYTHYYYIPIKYNSGLHYDIIIHVYIILW